MTAVLAPAAFDVCGPLPTGTTVLEASAGTGKTYTIAALAARYVAEGVATLPELMLVTFGREATRELRERVRERLVAAERALADPATARSSADAGARRCSPPRPDAEVARRRAPAGPRARARSTRPRSPPPTSSASRCSPGWGWPATPTRTRVFVESIDDLVTEVVDDFYVRKYGDRAGGAAAVRPRGRAGAGPRGGLRPAGARLEPRAAEPGAAADTRLPVRRGRARAEVDAAQARRGALHLRRHAHPARRRARPTRARRRRVPGCGRATGSCWSTSSRTPTRCSGTILRRAFHGHTDAGPDRRPEAGDLRVPRRRRRHLPRGHPRPADRPRHPRDQLAQRRAACSPPWTRSSAGPRSATSGSSCTRSAAAHAGPAADRGTRGCPGAGAGRRPGGAADAAATRRSRSSARRASWSSRDLAADVAASARQRGARSGRHAGATGRRRGARAHQRRRAASVRDGAGRRTACPPWSPARRACSAPPVAADWLTLLEALEQPRLARLRAAALTCFVGRTVERAVRRPAPTTLLDRAGRDRPQLGERCCASAGSRRCSRRVTADTELPGRAAGPHRRRATGSPTCGTSAQALHAATAAAHLGAGRARRVAAPADRRGGHRRRDAERSRRLESDAAAVQIITIHRSKGLEFPVVYVPFGWDRNVPAIPDVPLLHDDAGSACATSAGRAARAGSERCAAHRAEEAGEDLRLLYVALTRAQCQVVTWWVPSTTTATSPLHRLLHRPARGRAPEPAASYRVPADAGGAAAALRPPRLAGAGGRAGRRRRRGAGGSGTPAQAPSATLAAARFDRTLDRRGGAPPTPRSPRARATHARRPVGERAGGAGRPGRAPSPTRRGIGAAAATVASALRPAVPDGRPAAGHGVRHARARGARGRRPHRARPGRPSSPRRCAEQLVRHPLPGVDADAAGRRAGAGRSAPRSGRSRAALRLADVAPRDRLAELDFELPLAGGDRTRARHRRRSGEIAPLLRAHLPADDPLAALPRAAGRPRLLAEQPLRGYLTGSIDAVLRLPGGRASSSSTTRPTGSGPTPGGRSPLTAAHYSPRPPAPPR